MKSSGRVYTDSTGAVTGARFAPGELERVRVTPESVQDPEELARLLGTLFKAFAEATNQTRGEQYIDFEDVAFGAASSIVSLRHNLGKRPRWSIVRWSAASSSAYRIKEALDADGIPRSTTSVLVLESSLLGTGTVRVF